MRWRNGIGYWMVEENKKCRLYEKERETIAHAVRLYGATGREEGREILLGMKMG